MTDYKIALAGCCAILLSACQSLPTVTEPAEAEVCPTPEPVECPVCEVLSCPEPAVTEAPVQECPAVKETACPAAAELASRYPLIGEKEWALVEPGDVLLEARIDTGAETSSIHAENIQLVEKDGKRFVRFTIMDPASDREIQLERRLHRRILVKQTGTDEYDRRYVVRMWVTLGTTRTWLDLSLSDRDDFEFPLLIGRNMLMDAFAVDVSMHHTLPKPTPRPKAEPKPASPKPASKPASASAEPSPAAQPVSAAR